MNPTNVAWGMLVASFSMWWIVTNGFITYYEPQQKEIYLSLWKRFVDSVSVCEQCSPKLVSSPIEQLRSHQLSLVSIPDLIVAVKLIRTFSIGLLSAALALLITVVVLTGMKESKALPATFDADVVGTWLSLFSILIMLISAACILSLVPRLELKSVMIDVSQWRNRQ